ERTVARHGDVAAGQVDVHRGDTLDLAHLRLDRVDTVVARHADDGVGLHGRAVAGVTHVLLLSPRLLSPSRQHGVAFVDAPPGTARRAVSCGLVWSRRDRNVRKRHWRDDTACQERTRRAM